MSQLMKQKVDSWAKKYGVQIVCYPEFKQKGIKGYFIATSGKYAGLGFVKSLDAILTGAGISYMSLTVDAKESYLHRLVNKWGYTILEFPKDYRTDSPMLLKVPNSNEVWWVRPANFELGKRPKGTRGASLGEIFIRCVLDYNGLTYQTEVVTSIEGQIHRFDFVLSTGEHIEFQGEQHFKEVVFSYKSNNNLVNRKQRDTIKRNYCKSKQIPLIEVCYPATLENIMSQLKLSLPVKTPDKDFVLSYMEDYHNRTKRIAEYYKEHSGKDTSKKFNVSRRTVVESYKLIYGKPKGKGSISLQSQITKKANADFNKQVDNYFLTHTASETASKFNISPDYVRIGFSRRNGKSKRKYLQEVDN